MRTLASYGTNAGVIECSMSESVSFVITTKLGFGSRTRNTFLRYIGKRSVASAALVARAMGLRNLAALA